MFNQVELNLKNNNAAGEGASYRFKPFLRWAGGKRWLLKSIDKFMPADGFNDYHEPFVGGGAMFFHLKKNQAFISDLNEELIACYFAVKDDAKKVIEYLEGFGMSKEVYYQIRKSRPKGFYNQAARFIYLNQMSFNGIYRVNSKGEYNVPYGYRENFQFNYENLLQAGELLRDVILSHEDFEHIIDNVKAGDLVFLDPPYTVAHNNNGFIEYNQKIFSLKDQERLSKVINEIKEIGAYYILTNAAHETIREIFSIHNDTITEIQRSSLIGGASAKRGKYAEFIITNGVDR